MEALQQLFDAGSCTYTYLLSDEETRDCVFIDPVNPHLDEYLLLLENNSLNLVYVLETHAHADHITSAGELCRRTGARAATPVHCMITPADVQLEDGDEIHFGARETIRAIHTPGHTAGSMCFLWRNCVFTGDTLLVNGCGRTDFQGGDAGMLYDSITEKLFTLPDETLVYPAHDYNGAHHSTIGQERRTNARIAGRSRDEFILLMNNLHLPKPKLLDVAVPANRRLGLDVQQA